MTYYKCRHDQSTSKFRPAAQAILGLLGLYTVSEEHLDASRVLANEKNLFENPDHFVRRTHLRCCSLYKSPPPVDIRRAFHHSPDRQSAKKRRLCSLRSRKVW